MAVGLFRVTFTPTLSTPADPATNDFVFTLPDGFGDVTVGAIIDRVKAFYYSVTPGATASLGACMNNSYIGAGFDVDVYDISAHLDGSPHGSPVTIVHRTGANLAVDRAVLPLDVSIVLELRSEYGDAVEFGGPDATVPSSDAAVDQGAPATHAGRDRPRSRHRGRLFLGPLNESCADFPHSSGRPDVAGGAFANDACLSAGHLQVTVEAITPGVTEWVQWSRRDAAVRPITVAAVRNTFSTSKRRQDLGGVAASATFA